MAKAKKKTAAKKSAKKKTPRKKASPSSQAKYPRHSLTDALRIPTAILDQNAGKSCTDVQAAGFIGLKSAKGPTASKSVRESNMDSLIAPKARSSKSPNLVAKCFVQSLQTT